MKIWSGGGAEEVVGDGGMEAGGSGEDMVLSDGCNIEFLFFLRG